MGMVLSSSFSTFHVLIILLETHRFGNSSHVFFSDPVHLNGRNYLDFSCHFK
jgi:hypothetical protein